VGHTCQKTAQDWSVCAGVHFLELWPFCALFGCVRSSRLYVFQGPTELMPEVSWHAVRRHFLQGVTAVAGL